MITFPILLEKGEKQMDNKIQKLMDITKSKFGLENYYIGRHRLDRRVTIFNDTVYTLCMEWFPNHTKDHEDDDSNPEGTAVIEMDIHSEKYRSVIFVMGKTYADHGVEFDNSDKNDIFKWLEIETDLKNGRHFQLQKEKEGEFHFKECIDGVDVSPSGYIDIKMNEEGKLTLFSIHGQFPSKDSVKEEKYTLSLEKVKHLAEDQLQLLDYPSFEKKKRFPIYAVEEIYITNSGMSTIPFESREDAKSMIQLDQTITWDQPLQETFQRKEINWLEDISVEQAFSREPSPESFPIMMDEQEHCLAAVKDFLRKEYRDESGEWILKSMHRDKGYIHATLRHKNQTVSVFQRKLKCMMNGKNFEVVNFMDNKPMLEMFDQFQEPDEGTITKEEAFEKLKDLYELKPFYVYEAAVKQYLLCGKLDCHYGVNASTGEVIALDDL